MSIILFEKKRFEEARQCNAAALELMDFEAAR